jgi:hypothetical protein
MRFRKIIIDTNDKKLFSYYKQILDRNPNSDLSFCDETHEVIRQYLIKKKRGVRRERLENETLKISFPRQPITIYLGKYFLCIGFGKK